MLFLKYVGQTDLVQVYCDLATSGGGWTLVYTYGFENYNDFDNINNAVSPVPTWNAGEWKMTLSQ